MSFIKDLFFGGAGEKAAAATTEAAGVAAAAQGDALDYLKEREEIPQQFREEALLGLGGLYGLEGGTGSQQDLIDQARQSPLYSAILGGRQAGEDAILRHRSMTGGLRGGGVQGDLTDYAMQLENRALLESYNQQVSGLAGLAGLPSNANQIAGMTAGIGQTEAYGITGAAQARLKANQDSFGNVLGLGKLGVAAYTAIFSDIRLKQNIEFVGKRNGHNWYTWDWSEGAEVVGLTGSSEGYMAHQVFWTRPEAVGYRDGFITLNYDMLEVH